jgi:nitrite reductase (NADH) small subunit
VIGSRWVRVTGTDTIPLLEGRAVDLGGLEIALFNLGERYLAVENRCPHQGGPLADGIVAGGTVVCPLHAWKIRLDAGTVERPCGAPACVRTFATRVIDNVVLVELPAAESGAGLFSVPATSMAATGSSNPD